jgi:hypothetical protein
MTCEVSCFQNPVAVNPITYKDAVAAAYLNITNTGAY